MTTAPVHIITDEQIAEIEKAAKDKKAEGFLLAHNLSCDNLIALVGRLREAEKDAARMEWLATVNGLRIERENSIWYDIDGGSYISTHMLCANGTQFSGLRNLRIAIDTAMQGEQ